MSRACWEIFQRIHCNMAAPDVELETDIAFLPELEKGVWGKPPHKSPPTFQMI